MGNQRALALSSIDEPFTVLNGVEYGINETVFLAIGVAYTFSYVIHRER